MNVFLRSALNIALLITVSAPLVHLLKVIHVSVDIGAYLFYIGFPLVVSLICWGGVWKSSYKNTHANFFAFFMLMLLSTASAMTIHYEGDFTDIAGNALRVIFVMMCVLFYSNAKRKFPDYIEKILPRLSIAALFTTSLATVLMHIAGLDGLSVYFGLQVTAALISFAYGLVYRKPFFILFSLFAIIGSGKRGVMLACVAIFLVHGSILLRRGKFSRSFFMAGLVLLLIVCAYIFDLVPEQILSRVDFLVSDDVDVNRASAGRYEELEAALYALQEEPIAWVTGFGLGSTIVIDGVADSTVHFSPMAMLMIFGAPAVVLFYVILIFYSIVFFRKAVKGRLGDAYFIMVLVFVGEMFFSLTAFTLLQSYTMWITFAYLLAKTYASENVIENSVAE